MRKNNSIQYNIQYHILWTTKYRYKVLVNKVSLRTREIIRQCCNSMDVIIIKGLVGKEYIHILVSCPPNLSVSKLVQQLKRKTSKVLFSEYNDLKRIYCGQHLWSSGYFCHSVGTVKQKMIKEYIENQSNEYAEIFKIVD